MKHFNLKTDAQLIKLSLVGSLLACLAGTLSFNIETQTIARNESKVYGSTSLASTTAPKDKAVIPAKVSGGARKEKPTEQKKAKESVSDSESKESTDKSSLSVDLKDGIKIKGQYDQKQKKVFYEFVCETCSLKSDVIIMDNVEFSNLKALELALKKDAQEKLAAADKAKDDTAKEEAKVAAGKVKSDAAKIPLYTSDCDKLEEDGGNIADVISCQRDELKETIVPECKEKERALEKDKSSKSKSKVTCAKVVKSYYEKEMRLAIEAGMNTAIGSSAHREALGGIQMLIGNRLITSEMASELDQMTRQADVRSAQQVFNSVYATQMNVLCPANTCGNVDTAVKLASSSAAGAAASFLQSAKIQYSNGTIGLFGPNGFYSAAASSRRSVIDNNPEFMASFQNQYSDPMLQLNRGLSDTNGQKNPASVAALFQQYSLGGDATQIVVNQNGTVTIVPSVPQQQVGQQNLDPNLLQGRNSRNGLNVSPITINVPGLVQPGSAPQLQPGVQPQAPGGRLVN